MSAKTKSKPRVTLTFRNFFHGEEKGAHRKRVARTAAGIIAEVRANMGGGWGCRAVLTREQVAAVGGWETETGYALPDPQGRAPYAFVHVEAEGGAS